jgi:hypothetical protein
MRRSLSRFDEELAPDLRHVRAVAIVTVGISASLILLGSPHGRGPGTGPEA